MDERRFFKFREGENGEMVKPFLDHLEDLRWMIIKMAITLIIAMIVAFGFRIQLVQIIQWPLDSIDPDLAGNLQALGVADSMTISLQLAFYAGIVISFPFLLYFLAGFVMPALTEKEKHVVIPAALVGFGLFLIGVFFSYFLVLPQALAFFFKDASKLNWVPSWTVREYYSFVSQFTIAFGLSFELPVAVLTCVKLGFLDAKRLGFFRPYAYVLILIFAAVITPTQDIATLLLMGVPMIFLYEICVVIAHFMKKKSDEDVHEIESSE